MIFIYFFCAEVEKILKGSLDSIIPSHHLHLQWKFKLWAGKFAWDIKENIAGSCQQTFENKAIFCLYTSSKFFPPIILIFTEGEGDGIGSRLPFKIFSTLTLAMKRLLRSADITTVLGWFGNLGSVLGNNFYRQIWKSVGRIRTEKVVHAKDSI